MKIDKDEFEILMFNMTFWKDLEKEQLAKEISELLHKKVNVEDIEIIEVKYNPYLP